MSTVSENAELDIPDPDLIIQASEPTMRRRRARSRSRGTWWGWSRPLLSLVVTAFFAVPLYVALVNVFKPGTEIAGSPWSFPIPPTMSNILQVLTRPDALYWNGLLNSLEITAISMIAVTLLSAMLGYAIARSTRIGAKLLLVFLICGLMVPSAVILTPITQILRDLGLMNTAAGLILANMGYYIPFGVFVFAGFLRSVPIELEEAAALDGAGRFRTFWQIVFPLLKPATSSVLIFIGVWVWSDFLNPLIILGPTSGTTVTVGVYRAIGEHSSDVGSLFAFMFLASLPVIIFYLIFQRQFVKGLTGGASK